LVDGRALDHLGFCLMLNGAMEVEAGSLPVLAEAGDIVLLDLREPMRLIFGAQGSTTSVFTLWVPRARLPAQLCGRPALHGLLGNVVAPGITVAAAAFSALLSQLNVVTVEELDELVAGVVAFVGHAMSSCAASQPKQPAPLETLVTLCATSKATSPRATSAPRNWLQSLACPAPLCTAFSSRSEGGSFIRERRLARAHQELTTPGLQNRRIGQSLTRRVSTALRLSTVLFALPMARRRGTCASERAGFTLTLSLKQPDEIGVLARWLLETAERMYVFAGESNRYHSRPYRLVAGMPWRVLLERAKGQSVIGIVADEARLSSLVSASSLTR
jgi:AraC-binding-like domain